MPFHPPKPRRGLHRSNSERSLELGRVAHPHEGRWWPSSSCCRRRRLTTRRRLTERYATRTTPFHRLDRRLWMGRIVFLTCLLVTAVIIGTGSYRSLTTCERERADAVWRSTSREALLHAGDAIRNHQSAAVTAASVASETKPHVEDWNSGFVVLDGFERIASNALLPLQPQRETDDLHPPELFFAPFVSSADLNEWNDFALEYYASEEDRLPDPARVWSWDDDSQRYPYEGNTTWSSTHTDLVVPVFQTDQGNPSPWLFYNLHASETQGRPIDAILECVTRANADQTARDQVDRQCASLLRFAFRSSLRNSTDSPFSLLLQPIRPANDPSQVTGIVTTPLYWERVLRKAVSDDVQGIDCVISNRWESHTFRIDNGRVTSQNAGDTHQTRFRDKEASTVLTPDNFFTTYLEEDAPIFVLSLYPSQDFYDAYTTRKPKMATVAAVCTILFTFIFFFVYDSLVRQEFLAKKDLLEAKRRFMRFVSHEVRTPLNAVCMGLDMVQGELDTVVSSKRSDGYDGETTDCINMLQSVRLSAQSAVDVLNTMLNYDKVERNALSLDVNILPAWDLVANTVKEFVLPAANKHILLSWHVTENTANSRIAHDVESSGTDTVEQLAEDCKSVCYLGDSARLRQVLRNLLSNAVKFTNDHGSVSCCGVITRTPRKTEWQVLHSRNDAQVRRFGDVRITVTDTGCGMTQEQLSTVFREGSQFNVNEIQNIQGSGLGMYIAKEIIERHQGSLSARSDGLGLGTTFIVNLPLYEASAPNDSVPSTTIIGTQCSDSSSTSFKSPPPPEKSRGLLARIDEQDSVPTRARDEGTNTTDTSSEEPIRLRVLIVEDVLSNRKLLRRLLERQGHICIDVENGQLAVDMYRGDPGAFDTILMDYEMPVMNGPTAAKEMRRMGCEMVILGVTGNMLAEDVDYFCKCGANDVVAKPLRWPALEEAWRKHGLLERKSS